MPPRQPQTDTPQTATRDATRAAEVRAVAEDQRDVLVFSGRLDAAGVAPLWNRTLTLAAGSDAPLILDLAAVDYLDGSGAGLVLAARRAAEERGRRVSQRGLAAEFQPLYELYATGEETCAPPPPHHEPGWRRWTEQVGSITAHVWREVVRQVAFLGEASTALLWAARHPGRVRWRDMLLTCETAGINALPIIVLIGFLMGLIMAFQSALPMQRFGADIFIADLLGISMTRELGPLVTAILLAGRSGSAFAAEIGTMKVNEEVNALVTFDLDPVRFLALPRILAAMVVTPILTIFFNIFALIGGAFVIMSFGYPFIIFAQRVSNAVHVGDVLGGLFKALAFSMLVAGVGCEKGLTTGTGAKAVGASTTSSVVTSLVLIAVTDGVFAVVFYAVGL